MTDQKLTDFHVGQTVRVAHETYWGKSADADALPRETDLIVEGLHPAQTPTTGSLSIRGYEGIFGHLIFEPVEEEVAAPADNVDTLEKFSVGDRVTLREFNVPYGNDAKESWPSLVGAPATVIDADPDDDVIDVKWDDPEAGDSGSRWHAGWFQRASAPANDAPDSVVTEARIELAKARVEIDNLTDALRRDRETWHGERSSLTTAASDERRRLCEEIDYEKARVVDLIKEKTAEELHSEILQNALTFALTLLPVEERRMVESFEAGYRKGRTA